jgi:hypothetical protein
MAWAKFTDTFDDEEDTTLMSDNAVALHLCGVCCSSRLKTDGFISDARLLKLRAGRITGLKELLEGRAGSPPWWIKIDGGYQIRSFLKYNASKETRETKAKEAAERVAGYRESRKGAKNTEDSVTSNVQARGNTVRTSERTDARTAENEDCSGVRTPDVTQCVTPLPIPIPIPIPIPEIQEVAGTKNGEAPEIADPEPPAARLQPGSNFIFVGEPDPETGNPPDPVARPMPKSVGAILGKSNPLAAFDPTKLPVPEGHDQGEIDRKREALRRQREVIR